MPVNYSVTQQRTRNTGRAARHARKGENPPSARVLKTLDFVGATVRGTVESSLALGNVFYSQ